MNHRTLALLFVLFVSHALSEEVAYGPRLRLDAGYRQDRGQWTISGGEEGPNIISDLEWEDLEVYEVRISGEVPLGRVMLEGSLAYGDMVDGSNRDSDYAFDNREGEFSRSTADTEGDTLDLEVSVVVPFRVTESGILLRPLLGYGLHVQNHTDTNGVQVVDDPGLEAALFGEVSSLGAEDGFLGPFEGLNSTYDAEWTGPFVGLHARIPVGPRGMLLARYQFYVIQYDADLYWNLRDLPFENEADGIGHSLRLTYQHPMTEHTLISVEGSYTAFETDEGIQTDPEGFIELNGAEWESVGFRVGVVVLL
jgi:hypothetical protein